MEGLTERVRQGAANPPYFQMYRSTFTGSLQLPRLIDDIFEKSPELAAELFGLVVNHSNLDHRLVVVNARDLCDGLEFHDFFSCQDLEPRGCSPGARRIFIEFDHYEFIDRGWFPDKYGWMIESRGIDDKGIERVQATLVVEQNKLIIGPEAVVYFDLDSNGRIPGWPGGIEICWTTVSSHSRVRDGDPIDRYLVYPALVALERLNAEGESIRAHVPDQSPRWSPRGIALPPLFPFVIPSGRSFLNHHK
jgi:hypothetical protein